MGQLLKAIFLLGLAGVAHGATDWEVELDGRLVTVDGLQPFINGELGNTRYGGDESGARIGRLRFALSQSIGQIWSVHLDASSWGDHDKIPAGFASFRRRTIE